MKKNEIHFYYYSGTGNTLLVVREMAQTFEESGLKVTLYRIETTDPAAVRTNATIGLAFPVAFQSTFPFLWNFFRNLPVGRGTEIFMVDTMAAFSGAIVGPLKKILQKKRYHCLGAKEICMPNNWFPRKINAGKNAQKRKTGMAQARKYALDLISGKSHWHRVPLLPDLFFLLCCNPFMMKKINTAPGKNITVNKDKCTGCGLCRQLCPVENITLNTFPQWSDHCETCMRCLCFCPVDAIHIPGKTFMPYRTVKAGELMKDPH